MRAGQLLNSTKPGHGKTSDQSAAKKLMMVLKAKVAHVEFCLDKFCAQMIVAVTFTVCSSSKLDKIYAFCQILHNFTCTEA